MHILVADDEQDIRRVLRLLLTNAGHEVTEASDGEKAVEAIRADSSVDLCIMDIMMPRLNGVDATAQIRKFSAVPILFLTAKSLVGDKAVAYASGGDDYLVKPFAAKELLMKVDAMTRRYNSYASKGDGGADVIRLSFGVVVNAKSRDVEKNGAPVELRDKEYDVFNYLVKNRGRVVSATELYEAVWGEMCLPSSGNNITVHVLNLRRKLEDDPSSPKLIRTVWGKGYQID